MKYWLLYVRPVRPIVSEMERGIVESLFRALNFALTLSICWAAAFSPTRPNIFYLLAIIKTYVSCYLYDADMHRLFSGKWHIHQKRPKFYNA